MSDNRQQVLWPGWETTRLIGRGSFGAVYEIERELFGKREKAALKYISIPQSDGDIEELYSNGYDDASITEHFKGHLADIVREYSLMAELKGHTNVVYCDDIRYIQHDDGFGWDIFIKMELLRPLLKTLDKTASEEQVVKLGRDICNALVLCKDKGIVHRDIKPQNIFVSETGDYKLGDFGIAKMVERTIGGTKIGTYSYMAPEIYNNQPYGSASDIYSLGLVMYWLLNERRLPFLPLPPKTPTVAETDAARAARFSGKAIPAPKNGSEKLKAIVLKACAFDPKERYASAAEMLDALKGLGEKQPVPMPVPTPEPEPAPASRPVPQTEPVSSPQTNPVSDSKPTPVLQHVPQPVLVSVPQTETVPETKPVPAATPIPVPGPAEKSASYTNEHKKISWWLTFVLIALAVVIIVCIPRCNSDDERVITGISVSQLPAQQKCCVGETLNTDGLVIEVEYSDGTTKQVTSGFYCTPTEFSTTGRHSVSVYYQGHHTNFDVYVEETVHIHNWIPADCTNPKTCSACGETSGSAAGHSWTELSSYEVQCEVCQTPKPMTVYGRVNHYCAVETSRDDSFELTQSIKLSYPSWEAFQESTVQILFTDPYGNDIPTSLFSISWEGHSITMEPANLPPGFYCFTMRAGEECVSGWFTYGYSGKAYLAYPVVYVDSECTIKNSENSFYLTQMDGGIGTTNDLSHATLFTLDPTARLYGCSFGTDEGGVLTSDGEQIDFKLVGYMIHGEACQFVWEYEGWYLACDRIGNLYVTRTVNKECFWCFYNEQDKGIFPSVYR